MPICVHSWFPVWKAGFKRLVDREQYSRNFRVVDAIVFQNAESRRSIVCVCRDLSVVGACSEYRTLVFSSRASEVLSKPPNFVAAERVSITGG